VRRTANSPWQQEFRAMGSAAWASMGNNMLD
jgi:hypothetical protein